MQIQETVRLALEEDVGYRDITTEACVEASARGSALITAKQSLVVAGHAPAAEAFRQLGAAYTPLAEEGASVESGAPIARVAGPLRALLTGERVALNFLM